MGITIDWTSVDSVSKLAREQEQTFGPYSAEVAETLSRLGDLHFVAESFPEAEDCYWRALSIRQKVLGEEHPLTSASLTNLAELYEIQDRYAEAQRFYQWAMESKKQAMLKERSDRLESTQTMGPSPALIPERVPKLAEFKDARCRVCNRQLLDSPVCMYCTQGGGFDAMKILREAGLSITDPRSRRSGPVNVLLGQDNDLRIRLRDQVMKIGRHPNNHIVFPNDKHVSRHHATLTFRAANYFISDNNTVNGTYVNGQRIEGEYQLQQGDVIAIGTQVLQCEFTTSD